MCRIVGYWDFSKKSSSSYIEEMTDTLLSGGPDDYGIYSYDNNIYLGHRRLSIIELSKLGHQPMHYKNLTIIYNGEIYNYRSIRNELIDLGYQFQSNSDTEVILKAYDKWGEHCVKKFDGIWAFAILNKVDNHLFLSRDRFGVKPLYWYYDNNIFMFSSEIKAFYKHPKFKKEISQKALSKFFQYGYIGGELSIFDKCYKLKAGTNLIIDHEKNIKFNQYYSLKKGYHKELTYSLDNITINLKKKLTESILSRTVSDVDIGVFLSGGNDSSLVASILKNNGFNFETFTIGFNEKQFNEADIAQKISKHLGVKNHNLICNTKEAKEIIQQLPYIYDEPFGDSSSIPSILLSKFTSNHVKVALSGDGGDEQFFGYTRYPVTLQRYKQYSKYYNKYLYKLLTLFNNESLVNLYNKINSDSVSLEKYLRIKQSMNINSFEELYNIEFSIFKQEELNNLLPNTHTIQKSFFIEGLSNMKNMQYTDLKNYLPDDILVKIDRASMYYGLEVRDPLLSHHLVEYSASIPGHYKFQNNQTKYLLKSVLKEYLPLDIINLPKKGFSIPLQEWFSEDKNMKELLFDQLHNLRNDPFLNYSYIQSLLKRFDKKEYLVIYKLWLLFLYSQWKNTHLK